MRININENPHIISNFYSDNILRKYKPEYLANNYKNMQVDMGEYNIGEFYSLNEQTITMDNFISFKTKQDKKYQLKINAMDNANFKLPINVHKYFNYYTTGHVMPWKLIYNKLRISKSPWDFPEHFDCVDQIVVVLHGNRQFYINDIEYNLNTGDALYIPKGFNHYIKNIGTEISILCSFGLCSSDYIGSIEHTNYETKFALNWPTQHNICKTGKY
jgi:mannose-6-phosphate isomerase-like protein (cupin superfamily)